MTLKEVAEYLQLSREKLYLMVRDGDIPATKVASQWRFRKEEIDQWMIKLRSRERSSR